MLTRDLLEFWPTPQRVADCVKVDAEASSEAVSLAVHQPMLFERRVIGADSTQYDECDEHALLAAFLEPNLSDGRVILPIVGSSGVGKSHIVRWLEARMKAMHGADRRVVIRIPKGLSLKGVLGLLLEHLSGPIYDKYRQELVRAQEALDPNEAAGLLCEMLAYTLSTACETARQTLRTNPANADARECEAMCRPEMLPGLLRNQALRDQHFVRTIGRGKGVVGRLVEHLTEERSAGSEDDRKHLFTPDDLRFEDVDQGALGRPELRALNAFEAHEDRRRLAVKFLNAALDDAKQRLVRLDPTVSDLFEAIRRELLKEQKELILLVEDFVVLSGLQKQLLQVIIKEAIRDGRQVLCTMRTALAYTTGYLDAATVLTRAGVEYRIPDELTSEEDVLARVVRQVGAYLNASRLGQASLDQAYATDAGRVDNLRGWVPAFRADVEPDARGTLEAFGRSVDQYELFPFNENAIHELAREGCLESGRLVYNPRLVIKNVLHRVLQNREAFEGGRFPVDAFGGHARPLPAPVVEHVKRQVPPAELNRYLRFLAYWGGAPSRVSDIGFIDERVFGAFGFDKRRVGPQVPGQTSQSPTAPTSGPVRPVVEPSPTRTSELDPLEAKWKKILEDWRRGEALTQSNANQLRKWVAEALNGFVDWDWELFRPLGDATLDSWFRHVFIPRAGGGEGRGADESMVTVCSEAELESEVESARIHGAVMSIIQFHAVHNCTWDFEGAETALPRYTAYVETLSESARRFVRQRYFRHAWDPIAPLVQGLLIGARALGIEGANRDSHHTLIKAIFEPAPPTAPSTTTAEMDSAMMSWNTFTQTLRQCRSDSQREGQKYLSWRSHLLNLVGARQGGAGSVYALDVLRLKPAIEKTLTSWTLEPVTGSPTGSPEFMAFRGTAQALRRESAAIETVRQLLLQWHGRLSEWVGGDFDKTALLRELTDTVEAVRDAGIGAGLETHACMQLIDEFRKAPVKEALNDVAKIFAEAPRGSLLGVLGSGYESTIPISEELMGRFELLLSSVEAKLNSESEAHGEHPLSDALALLGTELRVTSKLLEETQSYGAT